MALMRALAFIAALSAASSAFAQSQPPRPLTPFDFVLGCWIGAFEGAGAITDERCLTARFGGAYVHDRHDVRGGSGPYGGETLFFFDAAEGRLTFVYAASDGGVQRGDAVPDGQGGLSFPPSTFVTATGDRLVLRGAWRPDGPDRFIATSEMLENGVWREHLRIRYRRTPSVAP